MIIREISRIKWIKPRKYQRGKIKLKSPFRTSPEGLPESKIQLEPMRLITMKPRITPTTNTMANEV